MGPRSRLVNVEATKYKNALSKVLAVNQGKFIQTKYAKKMDLITANEKAKKLSLKSVHKQFVVLLPDGDFETENTLSIEDGADIYSEWVKGVKQESDKKVKSGSVKKELNQETTDEMKTAKKSVPVKKVAPKKAAKKVAAKKVGTVKKTVTEKDSNGKAKHPRLQPIKGGAALEILNALKSKVCTKEELSKIAKTKIGNIPWYIGKIRNNGYKVEVTEKGYKWTK